MGSSLPLASLEKALGMGPAILPCTGSPAALSLSGGNSLEEQKTQHSDPRASAPHVTHRP